MDRNLWGEDNIITNNRNFFKYFWFFPFPHFKHLVTSTDIENSIMLLK